MKSMMVGLVVLAVPVFADQKVSRQALPPAVAAAADKEAQGATIKGYSKEVENGKTFYEVETVRNGKTRDLLLDSSGAVTEVEEQIEMASLPEAVQKGLRGAAGKGKITKVEAVKKGASTSYEAVVRHGVKNSEIKVDGDGIVVK